MTGAFRPPRESTAPGRRVLIGLRLVVLLLALALRTPGLDWGLPDETHPFSFHPDEYNVLRTLGAMEPRQLDFNPRYFHNPTLYYELCGAVYAASAALGVLPALDRSSFHQRPRDVATLYLLGRGLSAAAGALTALLVFELLLSLTRAAAPSLLGALVVALSPAHVVLSQYMDVDALLGLLAAAVLAVSVRQARSGSDRGALALGALVGLGTSTKYNGALLLVPALCAILIGSPPARSRLRRTLLLLLAAGVAFVAGTPYSLLDPGGFADGLRYVLAERVQGRWSSLGHGPLFPLLTTWPWLAGEVALAIGPLGLLAAVLRGRKEAIPPLLLLLTVYASVAATGTDYVRYSVAALPPLAIGCGLALARAGSRPVRAAAGLALLLALAVEGARTTSLLGLYAAPDVREEASSWLVRTYPPGTHVAVPREPYFFTPPALFRDYFYRGRSPSFRTTAGHFVVRSLDWDPGPLDGPDATPVVLSEHELLYPAAETAGNGRFLSVLLDARRFREVVRFDRPARFGRLLLEAPLPAPGSPYAAAAAARLRDERLPHDLKYLNPAVLVFEAVPAPALSAPGSVVPALSAPAAPEGGGSPA